MKKNKGVILLLAVGAAAILSLLGAFFFGSSFVNQRLAERQRQMAQAMQNAEAGIERALFDLRLDFINDLSSPSWADGDINGQPFAPNFNNYQDFLYVGTQLNEGSYAVQLWNVFGRNRDIRIRSTGTAGSVSQTILVYASIKNISLLDTAISAGSGQGGGYINGHAEIHGSVHILGDGLAEGENAMELKGGAYLSNNYESLFPPSFLNTLKPYVLPSIANEVGLKTLNAELRVRNGGVSLGGTSTVGEPDVYPAGIKEKFDGVYVTDGFNNTGAVFSDNGWNNGYDLGNIIPNPSLNDPHKGYPSYYDYYQANALVITPPGGTLTLRENTAYSSPSGNGSIQLDDKGNLIVTGIVYIIGNFNIGRSGGGAETFTYSGKGSILVRGNVNVNGNFLAKNSFPQVNLIGIMAGGNMKLGQDPHSEIMGLFYAENSVTVNKQTSIAGTIIGNTYTMDQVPAIYQVPATLDNLPPDYICDQPFWVMKVISWQKEQN